MLSDSVIWLTEVLSGVTSPELLSVLFTRYFYFFCAIAIVLPPPLPTSLAAPPPPWSSRIHRHSRPASISSPSPSSFLNLSRLCLLLSRLNLRRCLANISHHRRQHICRGACACASLAAPPPLSSHHGSPPTRGKYSLLPLF